MSSLSLKSCSVTAPLLVVDLTGVLVLRRFRERSVAKKLNLAHPNYTLTRMYEFRGALSDDIYIFIQF